MAEKRVLQMVFTDVAGKESIIRITSPKEGVSLADAQAAGAVIASKDVFYTKAGRLQAFKEARMVTTNSATLM